MLRFHNAINASEHPPCLKQVAGQLVSAIDEVEAEGNEPTNDPAVLILGAFVAFHTHADVNTRDGYHKLLDMCRARIEERSLQ